MMGKGTRQFSLSTSRWSGDFHLLEAGLREERGAALVETALSLVVFLTVLIGLFQMTLMLYTYHFISDAAREATRYAIVRGSNCVDLPDCNATATQIQTYVQNLPYPIFNRSNMTVTTTWPTTGNACTPHIAPDCNNPGNLVKIVVTYPYSLNIPFWSGATLNISSTSEMYISQ
jgi:Flp pilus assembly protein TadG